MLETSAELVLQQSTLIALIRQKSGTKISVKKLTTTKLLFQLELTVLPTPS
jgi:hypothetical protein